MNTNHLPEDPLLTQGASPNNYPENQGIGAAVGRHMDKAQNQKVLRLGLPGGETLVAVKLDGRQVTMSKDLADCLKVCGAAIEEDTPTDLRKVKRYCASCKAPGPAINGSLFYVCPSCAAKHRKRREASIDRTLRAMRKRNRKN